MKALSDVGDDVGAKAGRLAQLLRLGLPVPPAYVVSTPLAEGEIEVIAGELDHLLPTKLGGRVVVRSSADDEDRPAAVAPGVYESVLDLRTTRAVVDAIALCVDSLSGADAEAYRAWNPSDRKPLMSVVIQRLVLAELSGVLYTSSPVTDRAVMLVEWKEGYGTEIVAGSGRVESRELPRPATLPDTTDWTCAREHLWEKLTALGHQLETLYGGPQDIEWGYADGQVHLFQTRPAPLGVTRRGGASGRPVFAGIPARVMSRGYAVGRLGGAGSGADRGGGLLQGLRSPMVLPRAQMPTASELRTIGDAQGLLVAESNVLSHASAMVRERQIPVLQTDLADAVARYGDRMVVLDGFRGQVAALSELDPAERKRAVFAWVRQEAVKADVFSPKYETVVFDPRAQHRLWTHLAARAPVSTYVQRIFPFDFPDRVYCGISTRVQEVNGRHRLQFKHAQPLPDRPFRYDEEVNIEIADLAEAVHVLEPLGYRPRPAQERRIEEITLPEDVRATRNTWPGAPQPYLGVEGPVHGVLEEVLRAAELVDDDLAALDGKDLFDRMALGLEDLTF